MLPFLLILFGIEITLFALFIKKYTSFPLFSKKTGLAFLRLNVFNLGFLTIINARDWIIKNPEFFDKLLIMIVFLAFIYYCFTRNSDNRKYASNRIFFHQQVCLVLEEVEILLGERQQFSKSMQRTEVFRKDALYIIDKIDKIDKIKEVNEEKEPLIAYLKSCYRYKEYREFAYAAILYTDMEENLRVKYQTAIFEIATEYAKAQLLKCCSDGIVKKCIEQYEATGKDDLIDHLSAFLETWQ